MSVNVSFKDGADFINGIPHASGANEFFIWIEKRQGLHGALVSWGQTGIGQPTVWKTDFGSQAISHTAARAIITAVALPVVASLGAVYNLAIGITKIGLGVVTHMRNNKDE